VGRLREHSAQALAPVAEPQVREPDGPVRELERAELGAVPRRRRRRKVDHRDRGEGDRGSDAFDEVEELGGDRGHVTSPVMISGAPAARFAKHLRELVEGAGVLQNASC
jgi:hypothetical protein